MSDELKKVDVRLKLVDSGSLYSEEPLENPESAVRIMAGVLAGLDRENACVVNIDTTGRPINFNVVAIGDLNTSYVSMRNIFKAALLSNSASIMLLHNHPSSNPKMSRSDIAITKRLMYACQFMEIPLVDHVIVAGMTGECYSMRKHFPELFEGSDYQKVLSAVADMGADGMGDMAGEEEFLYGAMPDGTPRYGIYQIDHDSMGREYMFMGMSFLNEHGIEVSGQHYNLVYSGKLEKGDTLDSIYEKFNISRPKDFTGHSLSVSDVIVWNDGMEAKAYYVDSYGFKELPGFIRQREDAVIEGQIGGMEEMLLNTDDTYHKTVEDFKKETDKYFNSIGGMDAREAERIVREYILSKIRDTDVELVEAAVYGSRCRGTEREDSDLDVVMEYRGDFREYELFNLLHEEEFEVGGIKVDINPITADKTGTLAEYLADAQRYMDRELAFSIADRYILIQETDEGYDYSILGEDYREIDGGVYDDPDVTIREALADIVEDLKQNPDANGAKGQISEESALVPLNYDETTEKKESAESRQVFKIPDLSVTVEDMNKYGYVWHKMFPLGKEKAVELYGKGLPVQKLYPDDTEAYVQGPDDFEKHDGMYGIEREDWEKYYMKSREQEKTVKKPKQHTR